MLPQACRQYATPGLAGITVRGIVAAAVVACVVVGCGEPEPPEIAVRAVVAAGEEAAEARDLAELMEHVSPAFADEQGGDRDDLKNSLRGYLVSHQSVHLLTRIDRIEFPYRDYARVELTVGALGRETADAAVFDIAADIHDVVLELQLEDDDWKVVRAAWQPARVPP